MKRFVQTTIKTFAHACDQDLFWTRVGPNFYAEPKNPRRADAEAMNAEDTLGAISVRY